MTVSRWHEIELWKQFPYVLSVPESAASKKRLSALQEIISGVDPRGCFAGIIGSDRKVKRDEWSHDLLSAAVALEGIAELPETGTDVGNRFRLAATACRLLAAALVG